MPDHPVYTSDQGERHFSPPTTVIIAGHPRRNIGYCYPGIVTVYEREDHLATQAAKEREERAAENASRLAELEAEEVETVG